MLSAVEFPFYCSFKLISARMLLLHPHIFQTHDGTAPRQKLRRKSGLRCQRCSPLDLLTVRAEPDRNHVLGAREVSELVIAQLRGLYTIGCVEAGC